MEKKWCQILLSMMCISYRTATALPDDKSDKTTVVKHHISLADSDPVCVKAYLLHSQRQLVNRLMNGMLSEGIIEP